MKATLLYLSLAAILTFAGCTAETARRAAYDTMQNMSDMDCRSKPGANCPDRQSYDEYQRDLKKQ